MERPSFDGVSLTAHYTAAAWHALGVAEAERFVTPWGRALFAATQPVRWISPLIGLPDPLAILLEARHRILEHELARRPHGAYVEIAAGLSPRGTAYSRDPAVTYVEVDLPRQSALKARLVGDHRGPGQRFVAGDATGAAWVDETLTLLPGERALTALSEGLNAYLPRPAWKAVLRHTADLLRRAGGGVFLTDVNPRSAARGFGRYADVVLRAIRVVARSPLYLPVRDPEDARALFFQAGFDEVEIHDPRTHPATVGTSAARTRGVVLVAEARIRPTT